MSNPLQLWVVVPAKPLDEGKSRLASALTGEERRTLTRQLLAHTLDVILSVTEIAGVIVVSRDREVLDMAAKTGAHALREAGNQGMTRQDGQEQGLNQAIEQAAAFVQAQNGDALLFLPTDLPLIQAEDVAQIVGAWAQRRSCVVITPSQSGGTNALLLAPPEAITPAFGLDSFARHRRMAQEKGLCVEVVESPTLAWDVDTPEEYRLLVPLL